MSRLSAFALAGLFACTTASAKDEAPAGRSTPMPLPSKHFIYGTPLDTLPEGMEVVYFSMGCFWGAEEHFFKTPGVLSTAVGYAGGVTPNPTYEEVSEKQTGHAETVRVVYNPKLLPFDRLVRIFWESHDPTTGNRQGNDVGPEYRSAIYTTTDAQKKIALATKDVYQAALGRAGIAAPITTEIKELQHFYYAEDYHQQYCAKNPHGYCGHGGTGVRYPR
jgi:peptide-methionine (S)-S-oxide reductase